MRTKIKIGTLPIITMGLILVLINSCQKDEEHTDKITDKDGNVYTSVTIGTQVWMVENLKTTKFNDGTAIPLITSTSGNPGYTWYDEDAALYKESYGALYNWYAINSNKLCPSGWHVPTDAEWQTLTLNLDVNAQNVSGITSEIAGGKLKETGTTHWKTTSTEVTNESGFTALPGGHIYLGYGSPFYYNGSRGLYWSATEFTSNSAWYRTLWDSNTKVYRNSLDKAYGFSVRCLKN